MNAVVNIFKKYGYGFLVCSIILLGIFLRLKGLLDNPSLWHDECSLAWNIKFKNYAELFGELRFLQVAPPFFLISTKLLTNIFGFSEIVFRLISFISGGLSIVVFYFLSRELLTKKKSIILALILFVINTNLISYSYEFKQYSTDMLCVLLILLFYLKLEFSKIEYKKLLLFALLISLSIWFSFVSIFVITAVFINLLFKWQNFKSRVILLIPFLVSFLLYLKLYIFNTYQSTGQGMIDFWNDQFILPNFSNLLYLLIENIKYFFSPVKYLLFVFILFVWGIWIYLNEKKYYFLRIILLTFIFLVCASVFHIYPFSKRLILFLIPIIILFMTKPFDITAASNKIKSFLILMMMFFILLPQMQFATENIARKTNTGEYPREMMEIISKNIKPNDIIFVTKSSRAEYCYYSSFYNFKNNVIYDNSPTPPDDKLLKSLKALRRGGYWFYLPYDYSPQRATNKIIENWTEKNTKIIYKTKATQSLLLYVNKK